MREGEKEYYCFFFLKEPDDAACAGGLHAYTLTRGPTRGPTRLHAYTPTHLHAYTPTRLHACTPARGLQEGLQKPTSLSFILIFSNFFCPQDLMIRRALWAYKPPFEILDYNVLVWDDGPGEYIRMFVCVCVRERERKRERE